jgi:hypothetical protein
MIARSGTGWQYALADLSLILFMVTAAGVSEAAPDAAPHAAPARSEPVAVWQTGGPPLAEWLAAQPPDPRQQLTIVAPLGAANAALALAKASKRPARVLLDPAAIGAPFATLAYDSAQPETGQ